MIVALSNTMHITGREINSLLTEFVLIAIAIIVVTEVASVLLRRYLPRSANTTIDARLTRARTAASKIGINIGRGDLLRQFDTLKRQKLGFIGRLRYLRARRRLLGPTSRGVLQRHSRRDYRRDMLCQFLLRFISLFRLNGIVSADNFRIVLLAAAIVAIINEHSAPLKATLVHLRETIPWHSVLEWARQWYVLVSLVIVVLIVARSSPLVDRIRARDESAKDTNRLLAQLYGKLSNVARSATEYIKLVDESRPYIVARVARKATGGYYTWTHGYGLKHYHDRYWGNAPEPWSSSEAGKLDRACKEIADHLAEYRKNGLHTVANRLTLPVFLSLFECHIMFFRSEFSVEPLRTALLLDPLDKANWQIEDAVKQMTDAKRNGDEEAHELWRTRANGAIRNYADILDGRLVSAYVMLLHLNHINSFLNRRLHGTIRSRLASSFVR